MKTRVIGNGSQIVRLDKETRKTIGAETSDEIIEYIRKKIKKYDSILISDYGKGLITQYLLNKLIPLANSHNINLDESWEVVMDKCYGRDKNRYEKK